MPNVEHFNDLSAAMQKKLLDYIETNFKIGKTINRKFSAYTLKQAFTRIAASKEEHVTEQCFTEAMLSLGYTFKLGQNGKAYFNQYRCKSKP